MKIQQRLTSLNCWKGGNKKKYLVIHDVGVKGQSAEANAKYFNSAFRGASAHYFIDRTSIWQVVADNDCAWHVGDDKNDLDDGINNLNSIGLELIVEKDGTIHPQTKENAKWLVVLLQNKYNIPNENIVRHFDASGKNCPQYMNRDKKWTEWYAFYKFLTGTGAVEVPKQVIENKVTSITVQKGNTLWGLSKQYNVTVEQLKEWNNLKSDEIKIGQVLQLKESEAKKGTIVSKPALVNSSTTIANLKIDGYWGEQTTKALQQYLGTIVDGVISGQIKNHITSAIQGVHYGKGGSQVIKALQKVLGVKQDGYLGEITIRALQKRLGTIVDGKLSSPSLMVKALQKALNNGTL